MPGSPTRKDTHTLSRKDTTTLSRKDVPQGDGPPDGDQDAPTRCLPPRAGVVIHATVEHIGLVGDTDLSVNVKWPASTFCVQAGQKPAASADRQSNLQVAPQHGPDAPISQPLYGESPKDLEPQKKLELIMAELTALASETDLAKLKKELSKIVKK